MRSQGLNFKTPVDFLKKKKVQGITFTRSSVAYDAQFNQVPANVPRFNQGSLGQGLLIEEATTNLFPSAQSQSFDSPWTSGTLNGTYTVSINAGGSLTLSGGAIGTCNSGGTLTFTVTNATVTFTPTGAPTHSQLELKGYNTSWTLGGTTRALETCTLPTNVLKLNQGTIEIEVYITTAMLNQPSNNIFSHYTIGNERVSLQINSTNQIYCYTANSGGTTSTLAGDMISSQGQYKFAMSWSSSSLNLYKNGIPQGTPVLSPKLPSTQGGTISLCSIPSFSVNSPIRNVVISKVQRSTTEMANRDNPNIPGFTIDKNVTFAMPNLNDLRAYYETVAV